ncbi:hypothetical protein [[Mycobacterium] nativiensis]|uniref:DUF1918 domain-containing protein n=1 Tax=[Mycobacterium] nativiensis TaxID=2855503 RepID=A0ABU5Y0H0_9MYCO|nr:hypothetical protein [Mycolicibacter sp. MYC340]MEB3033517.1 hypothetical protein [Mycolicibacter sp. MYC340]
MTQQIREGDVVRENWSGFAGTVVEIDGDAATVQYPTGRKMRSRLDWLVPASVGRAA